MIVKPWASRTRPGLRYRFCRFHKTATRKVLFKALLNGFRDTDTNTDANRHLSLTLKLLEKFDATLADGDMAVESTINATLKKVRQLARIRTMIRQNLGNHGRVLPKHSNNLTYSTCRLLNHVAYSIMSPKTSLTRYRILENAMCKALDVVPISRAISVAVVPSTLFRKNASKSR